VELLAKIGHWVGVDLGGTWLRVVLSDEKGKFVDRIGEKVDKSSAEAISEQVVKIIRFLCKRKRFQVSFLKGVGIAATGPLMQDEGVLTKPVNIPFDLVPLTKPVSAELGLPVCLINDCAGAALGENTFGAAKGLDNFVFITIGTGIGCGAIVNGTLLLGKDGNGHEVGHFVIDSEGKLTCGCGKPGHWEGYCSGKNIPNFVRMKIKEFPQEVVNRSQLVERVGGDLSKLSAADLFDAAKQRDGLSLKIVDELGVLNAMGFANVISAYDPSLMTVGGTVTLKNKRMILSPIRKYVGKYTVNRVPKIEVTPLGDDVGLYGAVATAMKYLSSTR
jgi:glucokinase